VLQQVFIVEYTIAHQMCDACHRSEAQDFWRSLVQIRQKSDNRKTFFYLEQLILKHKAHENTLGIKPIHGELDKHFLFLFHIFVFIYLFCFDISDGLDFYYTTEGHARKMVDFLQSVLPIKYQHSKKLLSHDIHSNTYNYKFTYCVEIVPISKDSLICLSKTMTRQLGSISPLCLIYRVSNAIHLIDVTSCQSLY
jgi:nonsense-mediated mRNA decay protein 3